jgi:hypothetical protein
MYLGLGWRFWMSITFIFGIVNYAKQKTAHKQVPSGTIDPQCGGDMSL